ncbi:MAG: Flp pilus assembly complex ATPase component TadA, partial [Candidatus Omnitrophica bacterium]|nr:Flp pilus assembly complex ATPase component TadA [Candidatus Omnitrophota bacterium]
MTVALKANRTIGAIQVMNKHIGDQAGTFTLEDLKLLEEVADYSAKIIEMVEDGSQISANELAVYKARLSGFEYQDVEQAELDQALLETVGQNTLRRYKIVPLSKKGKSVVLAVVDPLDFEIIENFELMTGFKVKKKVISSAESITRAIDKYFPRETKENMTEALTQLQEQYEGSDGVNKIEVEEGLKEDSSPIVKLVTQVIETAYEKGASDIHIEPFESNVLVRFRVDGVMEKIFKIPKHAQNAFMSRLKIVANLNIAERRLPQDGRIAFAKAGGKYDVDLRVNIYPMIFGEKAVMRILDKTGSIVPLDKMGFSEHNLKTYRSIIKSPYGMILHVGPTGSGKTTTLYSA